MFRKPHTASAHLVCKTRRVEAHFQSNVVEKAPSGSAAVAAGHLNPPTPRPRGSAWGWACYPGDRKLSVREVQYRGVETVTTTGGWGAQRATMGLSGGALGRLAPVGRRKWKSKVFLKENIGFCRSRVLPSGSREGGLGVPGTSSGRRRASSVDSEDDFGPSGDDLGQLRSKHLVFGRTLETKICSDGRFLITFGSERAIR